MVEFYKHKSDDRFFYTKYTNGVYDSYVNLWETEFFKFSKHRTDFIAVFNYDGAFLVDKEFYKNSAKLSKKLNHLFSDSVFIGLKGVQNLFFKLYLQLVPSSGIKRHVVNTISDMENLFDVTMNDFQLLASYDEEN